MPRNPAPCVRPASEISDSLWGLLDAFSAAVSQQRILFDAIVVDPVVARSLDRRFNGFSPVSAAIDPEQRAGE